MQERADVPPGWQFIPPYDPTTYEQEERPRRSFLRDVAVEMRLGATAAVMRTLALAAVMVIARHALLVYGGR